MTKIVNGVEVPLTEEDLAQIAQDAADHAARVAAMIAANARSATRTALRQQWESLPAWIRGPYRPLFDSANALLDEGDDEAAVEMILAAEAHTGIAGDATVYQELGDRTRLDYFLLVQAQLAAGIAGLP